MVVEISCAHGSSVQNSQDKVHQHGKHKTEEKGRSEGNKTTHSSYFELEIPGQSTEGQIEITCHPEQASQESDSEAEDHQVTSESRGRQSILQLYSSGNRGWGFSGKSTPMCS
jgi:hypothetical protein